MKLDSPSYHSSSGNQVDLVDPGSIELLSRDNSSEALCTLSTNQSCEAENTSAGRGAISNGGGVTSAAYSVAELVAMRLPGLPRSPRRLRAKANTERWRFIVRERDDRASEKTYPIDALPTPAQRALVRMIRDGEVTVEGGSSLETSFERAARKRLFLVEAVHRQMSLGLSATEAYERVASNTEGKHSARSIRRWERSVRSLPKSQWLDALMPRGGEPAHYAPCHPKAWEFIVSDYLRPSRPSWAVCYETLSTVAAREGWTPIPHYRTLFRRLKTEISPTTIKLAREGEKALAVLVPAVERDHSVFAAGEAVNSDGHRFDTMVLWPDGKVERPILVGFQDIYSGKILSWRIDRTENTELIRFAFADLCSEWGIPSVAYFDNGRAYAAAEITGQLNHPFRFPENTDSEVCGVMTKLGVDVHWTKPYSGRSKPIERAWLDLCDSIAKHSLCHGAYTGNAPTNKPANYGTATVPLAQFVELARVQIAAHNAKTKRRSKVCGGRLSFDQAFAESYQQRTVRRPTDDQSRMLYLSMAVARTRGQDGAIWYLGNRFHARELTEHCGEHVIIRFDANDLSKGVHVYTTSNDHLCYAERIGAVGHNDKAAARDAARRGARFKRAEREFFEATATLDPAEIAALHLGPGRGNASKPAPAAVQLIPLSTVPKAPKVGPTPADHARALSQDDLLSSISHLRDALPRRRIVNE